MVPCFLCNPDFMNYPWSQLVHEIGILLCLTSKHQSTSQLAMSPLVVSHKSQHSNYSDCPHEARVNPDIQSTHRTNSDPGGIRTRVSLDTSRSYYHSTKVTKIILNCDGLKNIVGSQILSCLKNINPDSKSRTGLSIS